MPWAGDAQLSVGKDLDPLFIEICRRIRLFERDGRLMARKAGSKAARIASVNGLTDDPWAPVSIEKPRSFTLGDNRAFTYKTLRDLTMSGKWTPASLAKADEEEAEQTMLLVAEAFARGNSKTGGFRSRVIPMSKTVAQRMLTTTATDQSAYLMEDIALVDKALRNGIALLAANGLRESIKADHYARAATARAKLDHHADAMFFSVLWDMLEAGDEAARLYRRAQFMCDLSDIARVIFREQRSAIPCKAVMRPRAEARAEACLNYGLRAALKSAGLADHLPASERTDAPRETEDHAG